MNPANPEVILVGWAVICGGLFVLALLSGVLMGIVEHN